jgi:hypothetical protein
MPDGQNAREKVDANLHDLVARNIYRALDEIRALQGLFSKSRQ